MSISSSIMKTCRGNFTINWPRPFSWNSRTTSLIRDNLISQTRHHDSELNLNGWMCARNVVQHTCTSSQLMTAYIFTWRRQLETFYEYCPRNKRKYFLGILFRADFSLYITFFLPSCMYIIKLSFTEWKLFHGTKGTHRNNVMIKHFLNSPCHLNKLGEFFYNFYTTIPFSYWCENLNLLLNINSIHIKKENK